MSDAASHDHIDRRYLFWTCFIALVATSFGFISRFFMLEDWSTAFNLSKTQVGEIGGAGLYPFAISIVLFSLVIDKVGYKVAMWFALATHLISGVMTITANGYTMLYWAAFIGALGNGTVEAVINPVIATVYNKQKTQWLNILHAGWPAGLMLAGALTIGLLTTATSLEWSEKFGAISLGHNFWRIKCALVFIPVVIYGLMLIYCKFPINERVAAGVPYKEMLREPGGAGMFIVVALILVELGRVICDSLDEPTPYGVLLGASAAIAIVYGLAVRSAGRPLYVLMLVVMLLLATTELGTDGWIKDLLKPVMTGFELDSGWVLVYTASIMMVLRFLVGPILKVTKLGPLGLLSFSCVMVIIGFISLSRLTGGENPAPLVVLGAATIYGAGQCFFWPATLGFISERFPRGGALSLNAIAGVGMLGVGILGVPWLGYVQDTSVAGTLRQEHAEVYDATIKPEPDRLYGIFEYQSLDEQRAAVVTADQPAWGGIIDQARNKGKSEALLKVTILPGLMLVCYIGLIVYFMLRGGYKPVDLHAPIVAEDEAGG